MNVSPVDSWDAGGVTGAEVHVVDGLLAITIDQVDQRPADALDRRNIQLHRPRRRRPRLRAELERATICERRVLHPEGHRAGGRPVLTREALRERIGLGVDDEVDVALSMQGHVLGSMARHYRKPEALEQRPQQLRLRRRVFDELEPIRSHGILEKIGVHGGRASKWLQLQLS